MQVSTSMSQNISQLQQTKEKKGLSEVKTSFSEKISKEDVANIKEQMKANSQAIMQNSMLTQSSLSMKQDTLDFESFLKQIGYDGKPIDQLSQEEASELISEDGFFGIKQTSQRIADFVINGANGDEKLLRAGREGMLRGFSDAEKVWGSKLPDISQQTMKRAIELVDAEFAKNGYSILDQEV